MPRFRIPVATALACAGLVVISACRGNDEPAPPGDSAALFAVRSPAFDDGEEIPQRYTCDGSGNVPPLRWEKPPNPVKAFAVVVDDPDAPSGTYTHWIVVDLPASTRKVRDELAPEAHEAKNSAGSTGWTPPCPPEGDGAHHYRFTVYALREPTGLGDGAATEEARNAVERLANARGRISGTYARAS